jgi:hypothetical protein
MIGVSRSERVRLAPASRRRRLRGGPTAGVLVGYLILQWLGRTAGSTYLERCRVLPGDEVVSNPTIVSNHAITIEAAPADIWPWLTQLGWHRGGWYTPRWVDQVFFPANRPSAEHLDPRIMHEPVAGAVIPDGPAGKAEFVVAVAQPPHRLVLHSTSHVPARWRERYGVWIDWVWIFELRRLPEQDPPTSASASTRLLLRTRARTGPWWFSAGYVAALVPADFLMATGMLRGIRSRVRAERGIRSGRRHD